jgi:hypothetical protein
MAAEKPGTADSAIVGTSGRRLERRALAVRRARREVSWQTIRDALKLTPARLHHVEQQHTETAGE